jgi:hypothetical protein
VRLHADLVPVGGAGKATPPRGASPLVVQPLTGQPSPTMVATPEKPKEERRGVHHGGGGVSKPQGSAGGGDDVFEALKPGSLGKKPKEKSGGDEDIFENQGKGDSGDSGGTCTATISSKPWAEVSIDGKPTGKITPLVNYSIPCGKHRLTFKNTDLMIERNESVTLKAGQPFKKIFSLVENEL